ncbi:MAG: hypothetical protein ACSLEW_10610 [Nocardioides sp.]
MAPWPFVDVPMALALHIVWKRLLLALLAVAILASASLLVFRWWNLQLRSELARALAMAPAETQRYAWTDWAGIREEFAAFDTSTDTSPGSPPGSDQDLADAASAADLSSTSVIVDDAADLQAEVGFSPMSVDWELYAQSASGAVLLIRTDADAVTSALQGGPYVQRDGYWERSATDPPPIPELANIVVIASRNLVIASDSAEMVQRVADNIGERQATEAIREVAAPIQQALTAQIYSRDYVCTALSTSQATDEEQDAAALLISAAGTISPLSGFAIAADGSGQDAGVDVVLGFETEDQARSNLASRVALASGPAVGRGGDFADLFSVEAAEADGVVVHLRLQPLAGVPAVSDLASGPVLFAAC